MRGFADLTELLGINSIPGICCGWLFLHRRGSHPSQYWGKLTFTECEPQLLQFVVLIKVIVLLQLSLLSACLSLFTEPKYITQTKTFCSNERLFCWALWPPHIYKSIKGEGAKIFYPQWRLKSSKLIMGTKNPGSGWWRWELKMQSVVDTRLKGQHFLILPNPNYRV